MTAFQNTKSHNLQAQITDIARNIKLSRCEKLDEYGERSDYFGLYGDIIQELSTKSNTYINIFYKFSMLLVEYYSHYCPEEAIIAGIKAKADGKCHHKGFFGYLMEVDIKLHAANLQVRKQVLYQQLCDVLGDAKGLIAEFVDGYAKFVSIEAYDMMEYFDNGYNLETIVS